jgi:hypothetical protein
MKPKATQTELSVLTIKVDAVKVCIKGTTPLIYNAMSEKAQHELLLPGDKGRAARAERGLKHEPLLEFRGSAYTFREVDGDLPTRLYFKTGAFKKAIANAALRIPGVTKTEVGQLCWITEDRVPVYGVPQLMMAITRSADMAKTPDVRTRAILPKWACQFTVKAVAPLIKTENVVRLLMAAGVLMGIGDWRQEKGAGSYGQFEIVGPDDKEFAAILKGGGRGPQDKALAAPTPYDDETEKLLAWFDTEVKRRGLKVA